MEIYKSGYSMYAPSFRSYIGLKKDSNLTMSEKLESF